MKSIMLMMAFLFMAIPLASQGHAEKMAKEAAKPTAVMFFSENCGSCKILDPRMEEALTNVKEGAIDVVVFDFSNKEAIANTKAMAEEKGLNNVLQTYGARTGFVALLDKDGNITDKINISHNVDDITEKLNALL